MGLPLFGVPKYSIAPSEPESVAKRQREPAGASERNTFSRRTLSITELRPDNLNLQNNVARNFRSSHGSTFYTASLAQGKG